MKPRIPLPKKTEKVHKDRKKYNRTRDKFEDLSDANDIRAEQRTFNNEEPPDEN